MSTPISPICIQTMFSGAINKNYLTIPLKIKAEKETIETHALLDSGAGGEFIDQNYAKTLNLPVKILKTSKSHFTIGSDPIESNGMRTKPTDKIKHTSKRKNCQLLNALLNIEND